MPSRMTPSVRYRDIEVHYYYNAIEQSTHDTAVCVDTNTSNVNLSKNVTQVG